MKEKLREVYSIGLDYAQFLFGGFLFVAGILKIHQIVIGPFNQLHFDFLALENLSFGILSLIEMVIGLLICFSRRQLTVSIIGLGVYLFFLMIQIYNLNGGGISCNCLGSVDIPPLWMVVVDFLAVTVFASAAWATNKEHCEMGSENQLILPRLRLINSISIVALVTPFALFGLEFILDTSHSIKAPLVIDDSQTEFDKDREDHANIMIVNRGFEDIVLIGAQFT